MYVREASETDLKDTLSIEQKAFDPENVVDLVMDIFNDPTAKPDLSLIAIEEDRAVGHILFSNAWIHNETAKITMLAPLAVLPKYQKQGIGGKLIKTGLQKLCEANVDLVFVVGHPTYYPRFGFTSAYKFGFEPPFPISQKDADAWMVQELRQGIFGSVKGRVICCNALMKPEYWMR